MVRVHPVTPLMHTNKDKIQYLTPGNKYYFLDKNDIILGTDLYRSFNYPYTKNWKLVGDAMMPYLIGITVSEFARAMYKIEDSNIYSEYFEIIRNINVTIKI